jgi:hypothetical protein
MQKNILAGFRQSSRNTIRIQGEDRPHFIGLIFIIFNIMNNEKQRKAQVHTGTIKEWVLY